MSESCCTPTVNDRQADDGVCPVSGTPGRPVEFSTVAALTHHRLPARQEFRLCSERECDVVYFGSRGETIHLDHLNVAPSFKAGGSDIVCYCFLHRRGDIADDLRRDGSTGVLDSIRREVTAGQCACELRNPSGRCCLGEVQRTIGEIEAELSSGVAP